jgi:hypothetical protein
MRARGAWEHQIPTRKIVQHSNKKYVPRRRIYANLYQSFQWLGLADEADRLQRYIIALAH